MLDRRDIPELLDDDLGTPDEIATSLADLKRINRWFGGISTTGALIRRVLRKRNTNALRVLEVGGASGDSQKQLQNRFKQSSVTLDYTLLDLKASHLNGNFSGVVADALALPFRDGSFDLVSSALLLHHLQPNEIVTFVREALRVSRFAVIINDLRRARSHLALIYAGMPLFRSSITRHDSVASVYRAYTPTEIAEILSAHFDNQIEVTTHYLFRMGVIIWK